MAAPDSNLRWNNLRVRYSWPTDINNAPVAPQALIFLPVKQVFWWCRRKLWPFDHYVGFSISTAMNLFYQGTNATVEDCRF